MISEIIEGNGITLKVDCDNHEISAIFSILPKGEAKLISKQESASRYKMRLKLKGEKELIFSFSTPKHITKIGSNNNDGKYFKLLNTRFTKHGINPDMGEVEQKDNIKNLAIELQMLDAEVEEVLKSPEWNGEEEEEELEAWTRQEEFSPEIEEQAIEIIEKCSLFDEMLDLAENRVINQREKIGLTALISLSSFFDEPLHGITMAPPGHGKSAIMDVIFDMFPESRKEMFGKGSTPAALSNMTKFAEGKYVFKRKLVRIGDLGDFEEMKAFQVVLGIFREVMSEGRYSKTVTDTSNDENKSIRLEIEGIGSVQFSTVADKVEEQYGSRCIVYAPDVSKENTKKVVEFLKDDLMVKMNEMDFKEKRPVIACAIEKIATYMDKLDEEYEDVWVINPYMEDTYERLQLSELEKNVFRDTQQVRDLPKSIILCNIHKYDRYTWNNIVAYIIKPEDYIKTFPYFGKTVLQEVKNINPNQEPYLMHIWELTGKFEDSFKSYEEYDKEKINKGFWDVLIDDGLGFTLQDIMAKLQLSKSTVHPILEGLIKQKILYKWQDGKNYYFPTTELKGHLGMLSKTLFDEKSFEGDMDKLNGMYEEEVKRLEDKGFVKETER